MRLVASSNNLGAARELILRFLGYYPWTWGLVLLRGRPDVGQVHSIIVIGHPHPGRLSGILSRAGGLRPRTLNHILDWTNVANINVTNESIGIPRAPGRSLMTGIITISMRLQNGGI
jgi:hypothetical protein